MLKKIFFVVVAFVLFVQFVPHNFVKVNPEIVKKFSVLSFLNTPQQNQENYLHALNLESSGSYKDAYYSYNYVSRLYAAYPAALYHQGKCAEALDDYKTAIRKYKQITVECHDSELAPAAHYRLAQMYMRKTLYSKAKKELQHLEERHYETEYSKASYY
jgi:tetratricopeptide (TPR) repeat protein